MKILIGRGSCEITFEENDGRYAGKMLDISGDGSAKEFCIYRPLKMYWNSPSPGHPNRYIGTSVAEDEKIELVSYVIQEAKKLGYTFLLW